MNIDFETWWEQYGDSKTGNQIPEHFAKLIWNAARNQTCIVRSLLSQHPTCVYLTDGTKVTVERTKKTKGPAWLKVSNQSIIKAL